MYFFSFILLRILYWRKQMFIIIFKWYTDYRPWRWLFSIQRECSLKIITDYIWVSLFHQIMRTIQVALGFHTIEQESHCPVMKMKEGNLLTRFPTENTGLWKEMLRTVKSSFPPFSTNSQDHSLHRCTLGHTHT